MALLRNEAALTGGAADIVTNNVFNDNLATYSVTSCPGSDLSDACSGGALWTYQAVDNLQLTSNTFTSNAATGYSGSAPAGRLRSAMRTRRW